jgi:hypothetical protein
MSEPRFSGLKDLQDFIVTASEAKQSRECRSGLLRLYEPRNDGKTLHMNKFKHILSILIILAILVQTVSADIVAVLEIVSGGSDTELTVSEYRHLTDDLRTRARMALPESYSVLTRDNIIQLLPPDEEEAECLAESCAVDIGRAIGAEYITQGFVLSCTNP